ncbi:MAG: alpha-amylase family glycosyl hydrolase [Verrucomicrobiales bacterium]
MPPPFKASAGTYSVGFDTFDRFDLGDQDQMGTVPTKYGTKQDLLRLMAVAHRFGLRVYFDNVMAHNGGTARQVDPGTLFSSIPGFVPEDFHLVRRSDGGWRKATDFINWQNEWEVLNRNPFAWDIAQEVGNANGQNISFNPEAGNGAEGWWDTRSGPGSATPARTRITSTATIRRRPTRRAIRFSRLTVPRATRSPRT